MKLLHIEARKKFDISKLNLKPLDKFTEVSLASTVQYLDLLPVVEKYLKSKKIKVEIKKGAYHKGQVLGCNPNAFNKESKELLLMGDGKFHALNNAIKLEKEINIFNGEKLEKITKKEIETELKKIKGKQLKYLTSDKIGIIISSKKGQKLKNTSKLKEIFKNKKIYIFETETINPQEFDNFNYIEMWVNTACPGIERDHPKIINLDNVLKLQS
jgi:diphthamide biosynthesis enzyme Dph1/Dph2-like protein